MSLIRKLQALKYLITAPIVERQTFINWLNQEGRRKYASRLDFFYINILRLLPGFPEEALRHLNLFQLLERTEFFAALKVWYTDEDMSSLTRLLQKNQELAKILSNNLVLLVPVALDWHRFRLKYAVECAVGKATYLHRVYRLKIKNPAINIPLDSYYGLKNIIDFLESQFDSSLVLTPAQNNEISSLLELPLRQLTLDDIDKIFCKLNFAPAVLNQLDFSKLLAALRAIPDTEHHVLSTRLCARLFSLDRTLPNKEVLLAHIDAAVSKFDFNDISAANLAYLKEILGMHLALLTSPVLVSGQDMAATLDAYFKKFGDAFRSFSLPKYQQSLASLTTKEAIDTHERITLFFMSLSNTPIQCAELAALKTVINDFLKEFSQYKPVVNPAPIVPGTPPVPGTTSTPSSQELPPANQEVIMSSSQETSDEEEQPESAAMDDDPTPFTLQRAIPAAVAATAVIDDDSSPIVLQRVIPPAQLFQRQQMPMTVLGAGNKRRETGETETPETRERHEDKRSRLNPSANETAPPRPSGPR